MSSCWKQRRHIMLLKKKLKKNNKHGKYKNEHITKKRTRNQLQTHKSKQSLTHIIVQSFNENRCVMVEQEHICYGCPRTDASLLLTSKTNNDFLNTKISLPDDQAYTYVGSKTKHAFLCNTKTSPNFVPTSSQLRTNIVPTSYPIL
jgi:hypothetical protein